MRPSSLRLSPSYFSVKNANAFKFGSNDEAATALFTNISWNIENLDCWAIVGSSSSPARANVMSLLTGTVRVVPSPEWGGRVKPLVGLVGFKTRLAGTAFQDHSSRYFHIRDEEKLTVRQHLRSTVSTRAADLAADSTEESFEDLIFDTAKSLQMESFLDLPLVVLSNGQARREVHMKRFRSSETWSLIFQSRF
jgi:hypothetical protein